MSRSRRVGAYTAHEDARTAACSTIALVVAWNQPIYPFYVHWIVGGDAWSACWTFLSTPFFVAVPWLATRDSRAGRALLPAAGIANMIVSAKAFGPASGVAWFLIPCVLVALLAFRRGERGYVAPLLVLAASAFLVQPHLGAPLGTFSAADYARFARMNLYSAIGLSFVVLWSLGRAWLRDQNRSARVTA